MNIIKMAQTVLDRGVVLNVHYLVNAKEKFTLVCASQYATLFGIKPIESTYMDVIQDKPFDIESTNVIGFDYQLLPREVFTQDLMAATGLNSVYGENFLIKDTSYVSSINSLIQNQRASFTTNIINYLEPFQSKDKNLRAAHYLVRFFPKTLEADITDDELCEAVKKDIIEKFFTIKNNNEFILPGMRQIGITNEQLACEDPAFIAAVKFIWFSFIKKERDILIESLLEKKQNFTNDGTIDSLEEYINQYDDYIDLLKKIDITCLDNCKNVRQIINVWPDIVVPQPIYTYGN